jgi:PHD/YefM family antitoxin component YafN of YafNO toxin-antitoxin module
MDAVLTKVTTSISEFKKNPNESVAKAGNQAFAVLTNNKPSFYVVPPELFDEIAEILWDHQMKPLLDERMANHANAIPVEIDELIS